MPYENVDVNVDADVDVDEIGWNRLEWAGVDLNRL